MATDIANDDLGNACAGFATDEMAELKDIARRYTEASGLITKLAEWAGKATSTAVGWAIPTTVQDKIQEATALALRQAYDRIQHAGRSSVRNRDPDRFTTRG